MIRIERTLADNVLDGASLGALLLSWTLVLNAWSELPPTVPTHFGFGGEPDAWGSKGLLFLLPSIGIATFVLLLAILRIPHSYNYPWPITEVNAEVQYRRARRLIQWTNCLIQWFFSAIVYETIQIALGTPSSALTVLTPLFLIAIFSLIIGYLIFGHKGPSGRSEEA